MGFLSFEILRIISRTRNDVKSFNPSPPWGKYPALHNQPFPLLGKYPARRAGGWGIIASISDGERREGNGGTPPASALARAAARGDPPQSAACGRSQLPQRGSGSHAAARGDPPQSNVSRSDRRLLSGPTRTRRASPTGRPPHDAFCYLRPQPAPPKGERFKGEVPERTSEPFPLWGKYPALHNQPFPLWGKYPALHNQPFPLWGKYPSAARGMGEHREHQS